MKSHATDKQRVELHNYLKTHSSATTTDIRHKLDILAPAPRIFELRHKQNLNIVTTWDVAYNPGGTHHKVARYTLMSGTYTEATNG